MKRERMSTGRMWNTISGIWLTDRVCSNLVLCISGIRDIQNISGVPV